MLTPFILSLLGFTMILLLAKIMELTDMVVTRGLGLAVVGRLLLYSLPVLLHNTLPMATLLGVLLAFLRLSSDNEVTVLKASGISLNQLLPPVSLLAAVSALATLAVGLWFMPWGYSRFETLAFELARSRGDLVLKERVFMNTFKGMIIYVGKLPGKGTMRDVFIYDERKPDQVHSIVATRGRILPAQHGRVALQLFDGSIHSVGKGLRESRTVRFGTYQVLLKSVGMGSARRGKKFDKELYLGELLTALDTMPKGTTRYYVALMELHKKFAMPVACFVMALIALPLGAHAGKGRSWGLGAALFVFMAYYMILSMAWSLGDTGLYPPRVAVWMPNIVLGLLGFLVFRRSLKERNIPWLDNLLALQGRFTRWRKKRRQEPV